MKLNHLIKKIICSSVVSILAACGGDNHAHHTASQTATARDAHTALPVYTVVTDATYPPFEFTDGHGDIVGMEIDLLKAIAANQGFQVKFYHHPWTGFAEEFKTHKADIAAATLTDEERNHSYVDVSRPYFTSGYRVVTLNPELLKNDQWRTQKNIAVADNDDTIDDLISLYGVKAGQLKTERSLYLSLVAVVKGHASVALGDATVMMYYMNSPTFQQGGYQFTSLELLDKDNPKSDQLVFGVQKGNQVLLNQINIGLENIKRSGEYDQILKKWRMVNAH